MISISNLAKGYWLFLLTHPRFIKSQHHVSWCHPYFLVSKLSQTACSQGSLLAPLFLLFGSLLVELPHVEACIEAILSYQFRMCSPLNNPSFVQHQNLIGSQHC